MDDLRIIPAINNFVYCEGKFRNLQKKEKGMGRDLKII